MEFRKMVTITLYARQKKRHRCIEQTFGLYGRRGGWDDLREKHQNMYIIQCETDRQSRLDAWDSIVSLKNPHKKIYKKDCWKLIGKHNHNLKWTIILFSLKESVTIEAKGLKYLRLRSSPKRCLARKVKTIGSLNKYCQVKEGSVQIHHTWLQLSNIVKRQTYKKMSSCQKLCAWGSEEGWISSAERIFRAVQLFYMV